MGSWVDYSITWSYIVTQMKTKFGIDINDTEKFSYNEIMKYLKAIFDEHFESIRMVEQERELGNIPSITEYPH